MNEVFVKRIKSFLWRGGVLAVIAFVDYVGANVGILDLPTWSVTVIGLASGEVTKYLNTRT